MIARRRLVDRAFLWKRLRVCNVYRIHATSALYRVKQKSQRSRRFREIFLSPCIMRAWFIGLITSSRVLKPWERGVRQDLVIMLLVDNNSNFTFYGILLGLVFALKLE